LSKNADYNFKMRVYCDIVLVKINIVNATGKLRECGHTPRKQVFVLLGLNPKTFSVATLENVAYRSK